MHQDLEKIANIVLPPDPRDEMSILILAGDISSSFNQLKHFLEILSVRFPKIVVVSGNHEYYGSDFDEKNVLLEQLNSENVFHSAGTVLCSEFENVRIIFGTMWADGGKTLSEEAAVGHYLNDFHLIKKGARHFKVSDMKTLNAIHRNQIENFLKQQFDGKTVVVTHHLPSYSLCHPRFGTECNGGFASSCDRIFYEDFAPQLWIHGHTHDTIETKINNTDIICNPFGYRGEWGGTHNWYRALFVEL